MSFFETWQKAREFLLPAIEQTHGTHTEDDVIVMILAGKLKLWLVEKGALVTEFVEYPRMRVCNVFLGGGELDAVVDMHADVEKYAAENGCKRVTVCGRPGWHRVFGKNIDGYQCLGTSMYKDLP